MPALGKVIPGFGFSREPRNQKTREPESPRRGSSPVVVGALSPT